ncbi:SDR family NAD(P)-dependent oxidoreductase [Granulibacter bethesdensis]|uniref:SDR family NAD(P)-dependent oxidoreductase n=1 Tax=Granulibacter bethesdensis TaxID=364410 RepID=UPI0003F1E180|nr:SDR family NAD(P)-dependent oxidoreductase [Granulibacter bethesdensis]AHJ65305.1 Oxidoreductase [Granulibacter bethesdensis CGDNIH4]
MGQRDKQRIRQKGQIAAHHLAQEGAIAITGASSGIGAALAILCAFPGARLYLNGRDLQRLEETGQQCRDQGAQVRCFSADVRDEVAMAGWINGIAAEGERLGTLIANAGISPAMSGTATGSGLETPATTRAVFETNVTGMLNSVLPAMTLMQGQAVIDDALRGRIAVIASIAGLAPLPYAPSYSASKAAAQSWATAAASRAWKDGIRLSALCPGFIRTPMTDKNRFRMPFLMEAEDGASRILVAIAQGKIRYAFPWQMAALAHLTALLPPALTARLVPQ